MSTGWIFLVASAAVIAAIAAALAAAYKSGQADEKSKNLTRENADAVETSAIRDRLRHDDNFARRVRARFTR